MTTLSQTPQNILTQETLNAVLAEYDPSIGEKRKEFQEKMKTITNAILGTAQQKK